MFCRGARTLGSGFLIRSRAPKFFFVAWSRLLSQRPHVFLLPQASKPAEPAPLPVAALAVLCARRRHVLCRFLSCLCLLPASTEVSPASPPPPQRVQLLVRPAFLFPVSFSFQCPLRRQSLPLRETLLLACHILAVTCVLQSTVASSHCPNLRNLTGDLELMACSLDL